MRSQEPAPYVDWRRSQSMIEHSVLRKTVAMPVVDLALDSSMTGEVSCAAHPAQLCLHYAGKSSLAASALFFPMTTEKRRSSTQIK